MKYPRIKNSYKFIFALAILALILLIAVFIINIKKVARAQNQIKLYPTSYSLEAFDNITWQNPTRAFNQDLSDSASFSAFNEENSAFIQEKPKEETTTTTTPIEETTTITTTTIPLEPTTTIPQETTTTIPEETTTTIVPEETTTTTVNEEVTTTTTIPEETTTTTEPISFFKKIFGFLIPKVNAEEEKQTLNSASLIFENFSLPNDFDLSQIQNIQFRFSLAGKGQEGDKINISYFYQNEWRNLEELDLSNEISNNENGGYFLYALPIFENSEDLQNFKIKFTYSSKFQISDSKFSPVYLDSIWLEIEYEKLETELESEGGEIEIQPEGKIKLAEISPQKINFFYTDDNSGENLIIKTDNKTYTGLTRADVYFSVINEGNKPEQVGFQFYFPEHQGTVTKIEKWTENIPFEVDVSNYGPMEYSCQDGWEKIPNEEVEEIFGHYQCRSTGETKDCDSLSEDEKKCILDKVQVGSHKETKYRNVWRETNLSNNPLVDRRNFLEKILGFGPDKKSIPENFKVKKSISQSYTIASGETQYFKAEIAFPINSSGEFYIEVIGDKKGYGFLDPWWNSNWTYKKQINLTAGSGAGTDYQMKLLVGESSGSSGYNFHLEGHGKNDFSDLRFTDNDESTGLDYWIETISGTTPNQTATVWVEVKDSLDSNVTIYTYYGNAGASAASNGSNTFIFFDDFSGDLSKWTKEKELGTITLTGGYVECGGGTTSSPYGHTVLGSSATYTGFQDGIIEFKHYHAANGIGEVSYRGNYASNTGYKGRWDARSGSEQVFLKPPYSGWANIGTAVTKWITAGIWYRGKLVMHGNTMELYDNDSLKGTYTDTSYTSAGEISLQNHYGTYTRYDDVRVRKYASTEPAFSSAGNEETSNLAPTVSNVKLNNQNNIDLVESSTTTISATADLYDSSGCSTITSVTAKIYRSGVTNGKDCTENENNCYSVSSCTIENCSGNYASTTCSVDLWFNADPTDTDTPWSSEYWRAYLEATDSGSLTGSGYSPADAPDVNSLLALGVTNSINYGSLNPGDKNDPLDKITTVTATGNISLDVNLYGTNLCTDYPTCAGSSIPVGKQHYAATSSTPYSSGTSLLVDPGAELELNCSKTTDHTSPQTKNVYWGIEIPNPQKAGSYTGQITCTAIKNETPWP